MKTIEKELNDNELKMYQFIINQNPKYIYNIESNVGIGKIQMLKNIAAKMNVRFIEFRISMCELSDIVDNIDSCLNEPTLIIFNDINRTVSNIQEIIFNIIINRKTPSGLNINSDIYMVCCNGFDIKFDDYRIDSQYNVISNMYIKTLTI